VADPFAPNRIFLVVKNKVNRSGRANIVQRTGGRRDFARANIEANILEPKRGTARVGSGRFSVFPRAAQEKESKKCKITDGLGPRRRWALEKVTNELQRRRLDPGGRWVLSVICLELMTESEVHVSRAD